MANFKEVSRFFIDFISHPRQTLKDLDAQGNKMMLYFAMGSTACERGMESPLTEITPELEEIGPKEVVE